MSSGFLRDARHRRVSRVLSKVRKGYAMENRLIFRYQLLCAMEGRLKLVELADGSASLRK